MKQSEAAWTGVVDGKLWIVGREETAELYGLEVIKEDIADTASNYTRFICISKELEIYQGSRKNEFQKKYADLLKSRNQSIREDISAENLLKM